MEVSSGIGTGKVEVGGEDEVEDDDDDEDEECALLESVVAGAVAAIVDVLDVLESMAGSSMVEVDSCAGGDAVVEAVMLSVVGAMSGMCSPTAVALVVRFSSGRAAEEPLPNVEIVSSVLEELALAFGRVCDERAEVREVRARDLGGGSKCAAKASASSVSREETLDVGEFGVGRPLLRVGGGSEMAAVERVGGVDAGDVGTEGPSPPLAIALVILLSGTLDACEAVGEPADPEGGSRVRAATGIGAVDRDLVRESYSLREKKKVDS